MTSEYSYPRSLTLGYGNIETKDVVLPKIYPSFSISTLNTLPLLLHPANRSPNPDTKRRDAINQRQISHGSHNVSDWFGNPSIVINSRITGSHKACHGRDHLGPQGKEDRVRPCTSQVERSSNVASRPRRTSAIHYISYLPME